MNKSIFFLSVISFLMVSCSKSTYGYNMDTESSTTNITTTSIDDDKYLKLTNEGSYSFEVSDGHAYACYVPTCVNAFSFFGSGELFEMEFISSIHVHPLNNLKTNIEAGGESTYVYFFAEEGEYGVYSSTAVLKDYINVPVVIDFTIDVSYLINGSKFNLYFKPEEHYFAYTGECACGNYRANQIYSFEFGNSLNITLQPHESAYLKFSEARDNFALSFTSSIEADDLSTTVDGYSPQGDHYIRTNLTNIIENGGTIRYNDGVPVQYIEFWNASSSDVETFTVSGAR